MERLPKQPRICGYCGGKGYIQTIGEYECDSCHGTCFQHPIEFPPQPCNACRGRGKKIQNRREVCKPCNGQGTLPS